MTISAAKIQILKKIYYETKVEQILKESKWILIRKRSSKKINASQNTFEISEQSHHQLSGIFCIVELMGQRCEC